MRSVTSGSGSLQILLFGNRFRRGLLQMAFVYTTLAILALIFLLPFYWMLNTSLREPTRVFQLPPDWYPNPIRFFNYVESFSESSADIQKEVPFMRYVGNTVLVSVNGMLASMIASSLIAYAFARMEFPGKRAMFVGVISTLMVPFTILMVPQFILWRYLDWLDTFLPLTIPYWFGSAWNIFLLRQCF